MAQPIEMVQNDTAPDLTITVTRSGVAVNLTGATVILKIQDTSTRLTTNTGHQSCTINNPSGGVITYVFHTNDLPNPAIYKCDIEVTYSGGENETQPDPLYIIARPAVS